jgi:hypothetical protein
MSNILTPISYATDDLDTPMDSSVADAQQSWVNSQNDENNTNDNSGSAAMTDQDWNNGENENVSSRADSEWNEEEGEGSSNETKTQLDSSAKASE